MSDITRRRQAAGTPVGGQFATEARTEADVHLAAPEPALDARLSEALARYGIEAADVPADPEGVTLAEHWARTTALVDGDIIYAPDIAVYRQLQDRAKFDVGRDRGQSVMWLPSDTSLWDEPDLAVIKDADDPRWDDPEVRPIYVQSTRNGGGNREDYEDEITSMQAHPDFICDHDDSGDPTYATFYFEVPDRDALRQSVRTRADAGAQMTARAALADVTSGRRAPWALMPANPEHVARRDAARAELEATKEQLLDRRTAGEHGIPATNTMFLSRVEVRAEHRTDLDAAIAALETGAPASEPVARWEFSSAVDSVARVTKDFAAATEVAEQKAAARAVIDSGTLDPRVATMLAASIDQYPYRDAEDRLERATLERDRTLRRLHAARDAILPELERLARHADLSAIAHPRNPAAADALHWPGPQGTEPRPLPTDVVEDAL